MGVFHHAVGFGLGVLDRSGLDRLGLLLGLLTDGQRGPQDVRRPLADGRRGGLDGVLGPGLGIEEPLVQPLDVLVDGARAGTPGSRP